LGFYKKETILDKKDLEIIFQDDALVAVNKPNGLLVHRSSIASQESTFALQLIRDQTGKKVYPVHRLDRKTSGVLVFAFDGEIAKLLQEQFISQAIIKKYLAITRGYFPDEIEVDYPLTNDRNKKQDAITFFKMLKKTEIDIPFGGHPTSRYSLVEIFPKTGRQHQIRKHCNHLRHPIIGDRPHGCNKQNRFFKERWNLMTMLLHAKELSFVHPVSGQDLTLRAELNTEFIRMLEVLDL
jgi:tRNA pseudouridine65 synthase